MTLVYLLLGVGFFLPVGRIGQLMARENASARAEADIARILAPLPEVRESLLPVDFYDTWPQRQTPSDLPPRMFVLVAEDRPGRHRAAPEADLSTTGEFRTLVAAGWTEEERASLSREWWCQSCLDDHTDCAGACACPCTLVGVAA